MATVLQNSRSETWVSSIFKSYRRRRRKSSKSKNTVTEKDAAIVVDKLSSVIDSTEILDGQQPGTQRALVVVSKGTYELQDSFPMPEMRDPGDVMIRNHAVALNPIDWKSVDYNFCLPEFPWVTGRELAGVVEKVGSGVTRFKPGDKVWTSTYYRDIRAGCFQDFVVVPQHTVTSLPEGLDFESASCLGVGALTAAMTLWKWLDVPMPSSEVQDARNTSSAKPNPEYLLIWGGSTVTGQFATQLANKAGLEVISVCSERTESLLHDLGAKHIITRDGKSNEDIVKLIQQISGEGVTRAIDLVGTKTAAFCLEALSKTSPCLFAPLAMMSPNQEVAANVTVQNVEMKRFVLDESSHIYSAALNEMVSAKELRLPQLEILRGGLAKVEEGLQRLKKGDMDGKKLVVSMQQ